MHGEGGHAWQRGLRGEGGHVSQRDSMCDEGSMHGRECAWQAVGGGGTYVAGSMCGRGHEWQGCVCKIRPV